MASVGRVTSNFGDHGDQVYLVLSNFCNWLPFFAVHCGKLTVLLQTSLLNLRGQKRGVGKRMGETWVKQ